MMASEKFCLRWNDFESNISTAFRELRDDKDFFDVTLACNGDQIQAHKVILSACSPFFRNILRRNPHQHPLLYLKGVKYSDLQSVLNFMYHGEVNVAQEELNSFLAVAEELSVKGLTQNQNSSSAQNKSENFSAPSKPQILKPSISHSTERDQTPAKRPRQVPSAAVSANHTEDDDDIQEVVPVKSEPRDPPPNLSQSLSSAPQQPIFSQTQQSHILAQPDDDQALAYPDDSYEDYGQYGDEQEYQGGMAGMSVMRNHPGVGGAEGAEGVFEDPEDLLQFVKKDMEDGKFHCTFCGQFSHKYRSGARNHVESQHFPNIFTYPCTDCEMVFTTKSNFALHRSRKHINPKKKQERGFY